MTYETHESYSRKNHNNHDKGGLIFLIIFIAFFMIIFAAALFKRASGHEPPRQVQLPPTPHIVNAVITTQSADYTNVAIPTKPRNLIPVTIYRVHDADTITDCTIHLPLDIDLPNRSLRCYGFDAWEVSKVRHSADAGPISDEEIVLGLKAKDELIAMLLLPGKQGYAENRLFVDFVDSKDPYGRYDCWWWIKTDDKPTYLNVAQWGRDHGHQRVKAQDTK
jgi:hypothetical protein